MTTTTAWDIASDIGSPHTAITAIDRVEDDADTINYTRTDGEQAIVTIIYGDEGGEDIADGFTYTLANKAGDTYATGEDYADSVADLTAAIRQRITTWAQASGMHA